jgi:histidinol phosphatase-like PHP family hydrolase
MKKLTGLLICCFSFYTLTFSQNKSVPITDLHIHLRGAFLDAAVEKSKRENIQYGILASAGIDFIHNDHQIDSFILSMKKYPMFYVGIQAEGREWISLFSKETLQKLDYIVSDAMTFTDEKGRRNLIYLKDKTWIDDENQFMDYYVKIITEILNNEPINIYVNPTYLPVQISDKYEELWTQVRMERVISAAVKNGIAIEINNRYKIPSKKFIEMAKKAGAKFTVGTNNNNTNFSGAEYAIKMILECGLTEKDFYLPKTRNGVKR